MNVKEFSGKHSVALFFSSIVLFVMVVALGLLSFGRMGGGFGSDDGIGNRPTTTQNGKNFQKGDMQKNRAGGQTRGTVDFQAPTDSGTLAQ